MAGANKPLSVFCCLQLQLFQHLFLLQLCAHAHYVIIRWYSCSLNGVIIAHSAVAALTDGERVLIAAVLVPEPVADLEPKELLGVDLLEEVARHRTATVLFQQTARVHVDVKRRAV